MTDPLVRLPGPGRGPGGAPTAIALSPILSARYRSRDLERIRAAAPGARIVTVSVEGLADGPLGDVERSNIGKSDRKRRRSHHGHHLVRLREPMGDFVANHLIRQRHDHDRLIRARHYRSRAQFT